jgi:PAS domain S-box-containing protein
MNQQENTMAASGDILILEDDPAGIRLVSRKLEIANTSLSIRSARSRAPFLEALGSDKFDCLILDYSLPDIDGLQALRIASELAPTTPAIVFTGTVGEEKAIECMKAGAFDYILKTNPARLVAAVLSAIEHKHAIEGRIKAEAACMHANKQLTEILERISDGFLALDAEGKVTYVNSRGAQMLGSSQEELREKNFWEEFPDAVGQRFYGEYNRALKEQKRIFMEDLYLPWRKWFETRIYPSPDGLSIFFTDVSERKRSVDEPKTEER